MPRKHLYDGSGCCYLAKIASEDLALVLVKTLSSCCNLAFEFLRALITNSACKNGLSEEFKLLESRFSNELLISTGTSCGK